MATTLTDTRAALLLLEEDMAESHRRSVDGRFSVLTTAALNITDQVTTDRGRIDQRFDQMDQRFMQVDQRLDHLETDLAEVKTDLAKVTVQVERLPKIEAQMERLIGLIDQEERQGKKRRS